MEKDRFWFLLARKLSDRLTLEEEEEWRKLMDHNPELTRYYKIISRWWRAEDDNQTPGPDYSFWKLKNRMVQQKFSNKSLNGSRMLPIYFKTAWKHLVHNKTYSVINVLGLAFGICSCLIIYLIANYEFSFDRFHPDGDRIYRVVLDIENPVAGNDYRSQVPYAASLTIHSNLPGLKKQPIFSVIPRR